MSGNERACPDDLLAHARRRELSDLERRALAAHLELCAPCRAAAAVATLFDAIPEAQPGDDRLVARVAARVGRAQRRAGGQVLRVAAIVALVVLTGGGALAAWLAQRAVVQPVVAPPVEPATRTERRSAARPAAWPAPPGVEEAPVAEPPKPASTGERKRAPAARASAAPEPELAATPATLFAEANGVRRAGEVRKAITLYQSLRQRFPESEEARLSAISQGDLLLGQGEPAKAVAAYVDYLRAAPHGSLTEEALFGKARGLGLLGRSLEERETWRELARRFPRSAYQPAAERRLRELPP